MNNLENFKKKLANGESVIGMFMKTGDPAFVEVAGSAGMDYCILDMEHGPQDIEVMQNLVRAATIAGTIPIIRTADNNPNAIGKALDIGALGVQIPQISDATEAREAVNSAKFHPQGERGVCIYVRAAEYSLLDRKEYFKKANETLVILQVEGAKGVSNIDKIMEVEGIDIIFIGPYDLSQSLGCPGDITNPIVVSTMKSLIKKAELKNISVGTFVDTPENYKRWKEVGVQYLSYSVDVGIFAQACKNIVDFK